jgi:hypothetical protein
MFNKQSIFVQNVSRYLIFLLLFLPLSAVAQEMPGSSNRLTTGFTYVMKSQPAPFDGYLFTPASTIKLVVDFDIAIERVNLQNEYEIRKLVAEKDLRFDSLQISYDSLFERTSKIEQIKDEEIQRLKKIVEKSNSSNSLYWFAGGAAAGIVVTIVLFFVVKESR